MITGLPLWAFFAALKIYQKWFKKNTNYDAVTK